MAEAAISPFSNDGVRQQLLRFFEKAAGEPCGLGCHDPDRGFEFGLHSPRFDMDERVLDVGVQLMGQALIRYIDKTQAS